MESSKWVPPNVSLNFYFDCRYVYKKKIHNKINRCVAENLLWMGEKKKALIEIRGG